jgi:hypothetical protein
MRFPPEILLDIASYLKTSDFNHSPHLFSLALVSRSFQQIAEEHLYNTVALHSYRNINSFLLAVLARPERARLVHDLALFWTNGRIPFGQGGFDYALKTAFTSAFLTEHRITLQAPPGRRAASAPLLTPDPVDDKIELACVKYGLHPDLRRALAEDTMPPQVILLLRLLPSVTHLSLAGPHSDSWLCEALLFPQITGGLPITGCFRSIRSLSVNFHHSLHANHILACMLLPALDELELSCATDSWIRWHSHGVAHALQTARGTSTITRLYIPESCLSGDALADLIRMPRALRSFGYHRSGAWITWKEADWAAIAHALSEQPTLERFELVEQYTNSEDAPGTLGNVLSGLPRLTHIHAPWRALIHPHDIREHAPSLPDSLPLGLRELVLRNDAGKDIKGRARHLEDLLAQRDSLRQLHFDASSEDDAASRYEMQNLREMCVKAAVTAGTSKVSTWNWAFRPPSRISKLGTEC